MEPIDDEEPGDFVEFYTRRGCPISARLARQLQRRRLPLRFHDIWADERDAAFVRSVARGNETVPTVLIGDTALVAPSARQVLAVLADRAPHLLPVDDEPRDTGVIRIVRILTRRPHANGDDQAR
jgi:mycoredoxin